MEKARYVVAKAKLLDREISRNEWETWWMEILALVVVGQEENKITGLLFGKKEDQIREKYGNLAPPIQHKYYRKRRS